MNDALYQLLMAREVAEEECLRVSSDPNEFLRLIGRTPLEDGSDPRAMKPLQMAGGSKR
jgi:twitching motility protein PilT